MRLNKFIAHSGHCSRRKADQLIEAGQVLVNGEKAELGTPIDPHKDIITVEGEKLSTPAEFTYLMLHKPEGYVTTKADPNVEQTIYALIPQKYHHLNPVGRLDKNSEGLLLMTDDGDFLYKMTHPSQGGQKVYTVKLKKPPFPQDLDRLRKGIEIKEESGPYQTAPCQIRAQDSNKRFEVTLNEGRNRQVRKMFNAIGCPVVYLKRLKMGSYTLGDLKLGEWKLVQP